ncbi:putative secreted protein (Por secretion system target) [Arcicella aurantiaca]|uniref:Putative secreted protein (Por secretion system target) n=1 Tax=Arcicella aurantiaca TaxID=591202 RepID=A0A316DHI0_9BACT|nr:T9SS type A sorting domain-containing protein [Arcicella aurantiaca]PWK17631.1 putative secreted protein (Por secretion system target) [Arcicella aurantiaca]
MKKTFSAFIVFCLCTVLTYAQVKFKLTRQEDRQTYIVSMVSEETYEGNQNITGTAQVTLKVEGATNFLIREIMSLQPETNWVNNANLTKPALAPDYTYISFGMQTMAHSQFKYKKGEEISLFSFKNIGDVKAKVSLINNDQDIMALSTNKTQYNLKNYISILGHGPGNAYLSNVEPLPMSSENAVKTYLQIKNLYPNPASNKVIITWNNQLDDAEAIKKLDILIFDNTGLEKIRKSVNSSYGEQSQEIEVSSLKSGAYFFKLQRDDKYGTNTQKLMIIQ